MLIRSVRHAGVSINMAMQGLGVRGRSPAYFSMRHLREVAHWLSIGELQALAEHTVFPYVIAFFGQEQRTQMTESALCSAPSETLKALVAKGVVEYVPFRRYCPACARHELLTMETSYWHVSQNLPGVMACTAHQISLVRTTLTTHGMSRWFHELPHEVSGRRLLPGRPTIFDMELARRSVALLGSKSLLGPPRPQASCLQELLAKGFNYDLAFSPLKLALWLQHQMGGQPHRFGIPQKELDLKWAIRVVRPGGALGLSPFKRLALETAISLVDGSTAQSRGARDIKQRPIGRHGMDYRCQSLE